MHNTLCPNCNHSKEDIQHDFFDCPAYEAERNVMFSKIFSIYNSFDFDLSVKNLLGDFFSHDLKLSKKKEKAKYEAIVEYYHATGRFSGNRAPPKKSQ